MQGIYMIVCLKNKKVYIGQSVNVNARLKQHRYELNKGVHINNHLQNAWNKYGESSFVFSLIEALDGASPEYLTEREQYWIDYYGGINSNDNYNFKQASSKGKVSESTRELMRQRTLELHKDSDWVKRNAEAVKAGWTTEVRKRFSDSKKGIPLSSEHYNAICEAAKLRRGVQRSEDTKSKISQTLKGHEVSQETREKISKSLKGKPGHKMTEEQRKRISEGAKKGWETRRLNQLRAKSEEVEL